MAMLVFKEMLGLAHEHEREIIVEHQVRKK